ncbi:hypothetical protein E3N88_41426 [Mikania micrantha]|uniref:Amino acid transporter transmembrane domain-containing protein n=1 Tax=Mikania micrantha TaxID=192012 RepID=A0A5N6LQJ0_9ASTR|nr:hypothetical protein E3N88_41426 [Mikania micrantha]
MLDMLMMITWLCYGPCLQRLFASKEGSINGRKKDSSASCHVSSLMISGLSGNLETAQDQVSVGMGLLAGSTVMLLTVKWGTCIIVGKCDLQDSFALDNQDTKGFTLVATMTMAASVLPFIVVQFSQILHSTSGRQLAVLIGLVISIFLLTAYCIYQVYQPNIQKRRITFAKHKHVSSGILRYLKSNAFGRLVDDQGQLNREVLYKLVALLFLHFIHCVAISNQL